MKEKYCIFYESQHDGRRSLAERECSMFREREREKEESEKNVEKKKEERRRMERKGVLKRGGGKYRVPFAPPGSKLNECVPRNTKDFHGTLLHRTRGFGGARPTFFLSPFRVLPSSVPRFAWPRGNLNGNVNSRGEHVRRGLWSIRFVLFLLFSFHSLSLSLSYLYIFLSLRSRQRS